MIGFSQTEVRSPGDAITSAASRPIVSQTKSQQRRKIQSRNLSWARLQERRPTFGDRPSRLAQPLSLTLIKLTG
jgi:hypothetical protein